jgi:hypothetical protein
MYKSAYNIFQLDFPPPSFFFIFPSPFLVSAGLIAPSSYMSIQYFHHICPPSPFPLALSFPLVPTPRQELIHLAIIHFWKKKRHIHLLYFLLYPPPLIKAFPLVWASFHSCHFLGDFSSFSDAGHCTFQDSFFKKLYCGKKFNILSTYLMNFKV